MNKNEIEKLFEIMRLFFQCDNLLLNTYSDPTSSVSWVLSQNKEDFIKREEKRRAIAHIHGNKVNVNLYVAHKMSNEFVEKILIHEITHYLLLPQDTSGHPSFFWEEFDKNWKIWKKKKKQI